MSDEDSRYVDFLYRKATRQGDCIICHFSKNEDGYARIVTGEGAHRYVYGVQKGPIPEGMLVCHSCDEPACINIDHLWLGTDHDNKLDCMAKGRHTSQKPKSLTIPQELEAYYLLSLYMPYAKIGKRFGVSDQLIYQMANGKRGLYANPR